MLIHRVAAWRQILAIVALHVVGDTVRHISRDRQRCSDRAEELLHGGGRRLQRSTGGEKGRKWGGQGVDEEGRRRMQLGTIAVRPSCCHTDTALQHSSSNIQLLVSHWWRFFSAYRDLCKEHIPNNFLIQVI